jgi:hypothetical protein
MRDDTLEFGVVGDVPFDKDVVIIVAPSDREHFVGSRETQIIIGALEVETVQKAVVRTSVLGHRDHPPLDDT